MHDLGTPLILALIALQALVVFDSPKGPAQPTAFGAALMTIVAIAIMPVPIPVDRTLALSSWAVAIFSIFMALWSARQRVMGRRCATFSTEHWAANYDNHTDINDNGQR
jgi:hypothetical protein